MRIRLTRSLLYKVFHRNVKPNSITIVTRHTEWKLACKLCDVPMSPILIYKAQEMDGILLLQGHKLSPILRHKDQVMGSETESLSHEVAEMDRFDQKFDHTK